MLGTTYNEEFKWPEQTGWGRKIWLKDKNLEQNEISNAAPVYRSYETLLQITKECLTPFDYLLQPKPIIQTHPESPFSIEDLPKDDGSARLTRPRVYKAPEISLDDIDDPDIREKIINYTYSTTSGLAGKDAAGKVTKRHVPNSAWEPPYHVLFNKKENSNEAGCGTVYISDKELKEWDKKQSRVVVDPTRTFWQRFRSQEPVKIMDQSVIEVKSPYLTEKIMNLAKEEKLRFPFTLRPPNYVGFMPENPIGMDPLKVQREIKDPMLTVYQLANRECNSLKDYFKAKWLIKTVHIADGLRKKKTEPKIQKLRA